MVDKKYDLTMKVIFCRIHKEYFEKNVKVKLSDGALTVNPINLIYLMRFSKNCKDCEWKTLFGDEE